ncbi:hypothetical protein [uncultured Maricaulis sp.]|uniref:hypothetical protein n=1 Tax=uncultured Maricaulis sp. TaxID=174710 RepID=UPI0030D9E436|tara:strand:- start:37471 stop:38829 length:1359 start_codon:yes stop_codon:yes gene_type:complete
MSNLSPRQRSQLEALWRSMPPHMRSALYNSAKAAAAADPSGQLLLDVFDELEALMGEAAGDLAKAYLFAPLRPLTAEAGTVPPSKYRFSPDDLSKMWGWLGRQIAKELVEQARKCRKPATDPVWYDFRSQAAAALAEAVAKAGRVPKDMVALDKRFGPDCRAMLQDAIVLLKFSERIDLSMAEIPAVVDDLDPDLCEHIRAQHEALMAEEPESAVWILLLVMGRLTSPWQIFRVVEKIGRRADDLVVSKTELAAIGDTVLADTGFYAAKLKQPPGNREEAEQYFKVFERYVGYSTGMVQEFGIRKDGRWGRSLFGLRAEASTNVEKVMEKVPLALDAGLPEPRRGKSGRVIPAQLPPTAAVERATGLLYFLHRAREHANAAAIASAQKRIYEQVENRMQSAGKMLVDLVANSEGQSRLSAEESLAIVADLLEAAGSDEAAELLRRRGVAAAA